MATPISHEKKFSMGLAEEIFSIENWVITTRRSHILNSKCTSPAVCDATRLKYRPADQPPSAEKVTAADDDTSKGSAAPAGGDDQQQPAHSSLQQFGGAEHGTPRKTLEQVKQLKATIYGEPKLCLFCKFDLILEMAHFPDMTYAQNVLELRHRPSGLVVEFNVLDSLIPVIVNCTGLPTGMKVSPSEAWLRARLDCEYTKNVMNADFDWTFTTDYEGSYSLSSSTLPTAFTQPTTERIDIEKLKVRDTIHFYEEVDLFEDELADHGIAKCNVKIRVMPDSFFVLLRFFLRVDNVFVRFHDTRMYHEFGKPYLLREVTRREAPIPELALKEDEAPHLLVSPAELYSHVPELSLRVEKIMLSEGGAGAGGSDK